MTRTLAGLKIRRVDLSLIIMDEPEGPEKESKRLELKYVTADISCLQPEVDRLEADYSIEEPSDKPVTVILGDLK